jgi:membrane-associated phospholipid phosphatase
VAPPLLVALAFATTIAAGLLIRSVPALEALNTWGFHLINGLACGATPETPFYRFMWTGFNQTATNYVVLYAIATAYVLLRRPAQWPRLLFVGLVVAGVGALSNPVIWHWAWAEQYQPQWASYSSFVSGHARETAAEITILATFWRRIRPLGLLYLALLGFSRVYIGVHFPLDVVCGTLLGWAIARIAFRAYDAYVAPRLERHPAPWLPGHPGVRDTSPLPGVPS